MGACVCVRVWGNGYGLYGKAPPEKSGEVPPNRVGFERLDSKIGYTYRISSDDNWGRFFFFFFSRRWREGLEGDYLWEPITLNISLKGVRGRLLEGGD